MIRETNYRGYAEMQSAALAEIRAGGLDPDRIRLRGIDRDGYNEFVLDVDGNYVLRPDGSRITRRRSWPRAFRWPFRTARLGPILRFARAYGQW